MPRKVFLGGNGVASVASQHRSALGLGESNPLMEGNTKPTVRRDGSALVVGDRWRDTSEFTNWYWNGTYWLSEHRFLFPVSIGFTSSGFSIGCLDAFSGSNLFVESFAAGLFRNAPFNTTDFWTIELRRTTASASSTTISTLTFNETLASGTDAIRKQNTVNLHLDVTALGIVNYRIFATKVAAGGNISFGTATIACRLAKP